MMSPYCGIYLMGLFAVTEESSPCRLFGPGTTLDVAEELAPRVEDRRLLTWISTCDCGPAIRRPDSIHDVMR